MERERDFVPHKVVVRSTFIMEEYSSSLFFTLFQFIHAKRERERNAINLISPPNKTKNSVCIISTEIYFHICALCRIAHGASIHSHVAIIAETQVQTWQQEQCSFFWTTFPTKSRTTRRGWICTRSTSLLHHHHRGSRLLCFSIVINMHRNRIIGFTITTSF